MVHFSARAQEVLSFSADLERRGIFFASEVLLHLKSFAITCALAEFAIRSEVRFVETKGKSVRLKIRKSTVSRK